MRYLTLASNYTGFCVMDDFEGQISCHDLNLSEKFCKELDEWNNEYKIIIPLDCNERVKSSAIINNLDKRGIGFAKILADSIKGGAKVKYFSEGLLKPLGLAESCKKFTQYDIL